MPESRQDFLDRIHKQDRIAERLWDENQVTYQGVPLYLSQDFKRNTDLRSFKGAAGLTFDRLYDSRYLLGIFPGFQLAFEDKEMRAIVFDQERNIVPEYLYHAKTKTLYASQRSHADVGVFAHEFGHHMHTFFQDSHHRIFLDRQRWLIEENGLRRPMGVNDLQAWATEKEDGMEEVIPICILLGPDGERLKSRYRYSNPLEMVAEVVADHEQEIWSYAQDAKPSQEEVIELILSKIPPFR